ncbi:MAG: hypothetical protein Q9M13_00510 [Mariprofundales bacterium]|nr:hypothetical protein [Mariprofundales bacterium]
MTDIKQAIKNLDATLHPDSSSSEQPPESSDIIELTQDMMITPPAADREFRQQIVHEVIERIEAQLPQLIATEVDSVISDQGVKNQQ